MHGGAGAYICGEETALLDSLEGKRGQPRLKPPFPATNGLYDAPTVVNNVGTLASVPYIVLGGADWFKQMGPEGSPGPCIYSLSGRVANPGQYEAPMGTTLRELLELAGGMSRGKELKFWTPGGSSTPLFTARAPRRPARLRLGGQGRLDERHVRDDDLRRGRLRRARRAEVVAVLQARVVRQVHAVPRGHLLVRRHLRPARARRRHAGGLDTLLDLSDNILGRSFCALGDGATSPVSSSIKYFRDEYLAHVDGQRLPVRAQDRTLAGAH